MLNFYHIFCFAFSLLLLLLLLLLLNLIIRSDTIARELNNDDDDDGIPYNPNAKHTEASGGFPDDLFIIPMSEENLSALHCTICTSVVKDPICNSNCRHIFCKQCITILFQKTIRSFRKCPNCQEPWKCRSLTTLEKLGWYDQRVRCPYEGCEGTIYADIVKHMETCEKAPTCKHCNQKKYFSNFDGDSEHMCLKVWNECKRELETKINTLAQKNAEKDEELTHVRSQISQYEDIIQTLQNDRIRHDVRITRQNQHYILVNNSPGITEHSNVDINSPKTAIIHYNREIYEHTIRHPDNTNWQSVLEAAKRHFEVESSDSVLLDMRYRARRSGNISPDLQNGYHLYLLNDSLPRRGHPLTVFMNKRRRIR